MSADQDRTEKLPVTDAETTELPATDAETTELPTPEPVTPEPTTAEPVTPEPTAAEPVTAEQTTPVEPVVPARARLRVGTVVWGLVIAMTGVVLVALASGAEIDVELAAIVLLGVAGVGLLVGSVAMATRRPRR